MKIRFAIITGILLFSITAFSQERTKSAWEISFHHKSRFNSNPYENNTTEINIGTPGYGLSLKKLYNPGAKKLFLTFGGGLSKWKSNIRYPNMEKFVDHFDLEYELNDEDYNLKQVEILFEPYYFNLSFGTRHLLIEKRRFQLYQELEMINYVKVKDNTDIIFYRTNATSESYDPFPDFESDAGFNFSTFDNYSESPSISNNHPSENIFEAKYINKATKLVSELNYNFGVLLMISKRIGFAANVNINKSLFVNEKTIIDNYWGIGSTIKIHVTF